MLRSVLVASALAALLAGCVTQSPPPSQPPKPAFEGAQAPEAGQTRLYVFRPRSEDPELQHEAPTLFINDRPITSLAEGTYADLQLPPGRHSLALAPPSGGSDLWRTNMTLLLRGDSINYVSLSMTPGMERKPASSGADETVLLVLPVGDPEDTAAHLRVDRPQGAVAEPVLRACCERAYPSAQ